MTKSRDCSLNILIMKPNKNTSNNLFLIFASLGYFLDTLSKTIIQTIINGYMPTIAMN